MTSGCTKQYISLVSVEQGVAALHFLSISDLFEFVIFNRKEERFWMKALLCFNPKASFNNVESQSLY